MVQNRKFGCFLNLDRMKYFSYSVGALQINKVIMKSNYIPSTVTTVYTTIRSTIIADLIKDLWKAYSNLSRSIPTSAGETMHLSTKSSSEVIV